jgi:peptidyl-prolyl cis-trans isomerase C
MTLIQPARAPGVASARRGGAARAAATWLMSLGSRVAREPLFHFFVVGALLFALGQQHKAATDTYRIVVTPERVAKLEADYRAQFGQGPSPAGRQRLVDQWIDEEVLFRQAKAMKLDQDDEIVRRRLVQKMQFLQQDLSPPAEPSEADLQAFYRAHAALYAAPARVSFSHIYFSPDHGEAAGRAAALAALARLDDSTVRAPERGDNFPDLYDYAGFGPDEATRLFGDTEVAHALFTAPTGKWSGPFRSGYGWHLIRVSSVEPAHSPPLAEIHDRVRADAIAATQATANRRAFARLKSRFTVVRQDRAATP